MTKLTAIQKVVVGSGGSSYIDFNSIPQTFTDLVIKLSGRGTTGGENNITITFNGGGGTYTGKRLYGTGTGIASDSTAQWAGFSASSAHSSNTFSNTEIYIQNYKSSSAKSFNVHTANENASSSCLLGIGTQLWSGTSAISSIRLTPDNPFAQYSTATLYGITSAADGAKATGGNIYSDGNYVYHVFRTSGTFTPTSNLSADVLVLGGGGGGGGTSGGGGGAGGLIHGTSLALTANTNYTATVGGGGSLTPGQNGANGVSSSFNSRVGVGGGGGGTSAINTNGVAGGCGGAGSGYGGSKLGGASTQDSSGGTGYGFAGGNGDDGEYRGGGGGGTGQVGYSSSASQPGIGGNGTYLFASWLNATGTGINGYIGGGGGGGGYYSGNPATGGLGGGGTGSNRTGGGTAGIVNCGGGGGGSSDTSNNGTNGSSGVVIVRYAI